MVDEVFKGFPSKVKVGHITYSIELLPSEFLTGRYGDCDSEKQVVRFDQEMLTDRACEVVVHEFMHAVWDAYKLSEPIREEEAVSALAAGTVAVIRNNPKLKRWLVDKL